MESLLQILPELSVAVAITLIWALVTYKIVQMFMKMITEKDQNYVNYVEENNHQSVEQMKEYTRALGEHTNVLKSVDENIKSLLRK